MIALIYICELSIYELDDDSLFILKYTSVNSIYEPDDG